MLEDWCKKRKKCQEQQVVKDELDAAKEALLNFDKLTLPAGLFILITVSKQCQ
jgi:hypothetical protein